MNQPPKKKIIGENKIWKCKLSKKQKNLCKRNKKTENVSCQKNFKNFVPKQEKPLWQINKKKIICEKKNFLHRKRLCSNGDLRPLWWRGGGCKPNILDVSDRAFKFFFIVNRIEHEKLKQTTAEYEKLKQTTAELPFGWVLVFSPQNTRAIINNYRITIFLHHHHLKKACRRL